MKILKKILLWVLIVIVAVSLLAQLLPSEWKVSRTVVIQATPESIYPWLVNVENWEQWNAFSTNDPDIVHAYPGTTVGVGAQDVWKSKKFGDGSATITSADVARGVGFDLRFDRMKDQVSPGAFEFTPVEGGTQVVYWVSGKHGRNPVHRIFGLFMDGFLGKMFDESLANLKKLAEANPVVPTSEVAATDPAAEDSAAAPADRAAGTAAGVGAGGGVQTGPSVP
jgi:hypothetical protein